MGVVYRAEDLRLQRTVALKFLPAPLSADHSAVERFMVEAHAASVLDHPNICTIHEVAETEEGSPYIVMACDTLAALIMWSKDISRTIDYLETRDDIDAERIAYLGSSWGGAMGGIVLGVEKRFRAAVLNVAGLFVQKSQPVVDPIHFLPRVDTPVLMLNGKYDFLLPLRNESATVLQAPGNGRGAQEASRL